MDEKQEKQTGYEPPDVEEVLSAEELSREVNYAGAPISGGGAG